MQARKFRPELTIFDCDGVLVDSERVANRVFAKILKELCGLELTQTQMYEKFVGRSKVQCLEVLEEMLGEPPPASVEKRYIQDINKALAESVEAVTGVESILERLNIPFCVASSGSYDKMDMTLGRTGLKKYFGGRIFSTSDVSRGKPHPDIYLHAAHQLGFSNPAQTLVIEDSPVGVSGGVSAGMQVCGFAELMPVSLLKAAGADEVVDSMSNLAELLDPGILS